MTWTPTSSPTRRAAAAPASVGLHGPDVAADDGGDEARVHLLPSHEDDVRGLAHRVGGFDHPDEAAGLDHAERVADVAFLFFSHRSLLNG